jgi:hypothetical protein
MQSTISSALCYALIQLQVVRQMRFGPFEFTKKRGRLIYLRLAVPPIARANSAAAAGL